MPRLIAWKRAVAFAAGWGLVLATSMSAPVGKESSQSRVRVSFDSFVNWDFRHRKRLQAWRATSEILGRIIQTCDPRAHIHSSIENGTPEQLRQFLHALPSATDCDLSVVYLASHQSPAGEWAFVQERSASWSELLAGVAIPAHPRRVVILDACFAAAALRHPLWAETLGTTCVYSSSASEDTHELSLRNRLPIDMQRRYPTASAWINGHLAANRDGRLSFMGFALAQAFVASGSPPRSYSDWIELLRRSERAASDFRQNTSRRFASEIVLLIKAPE